MSRTPNPLMIALLNKCDEGHMVFLHCVPTRIIRVLQTDAGGCGFRVEQLVEHGGFGTANPRGAWHTLAVYTNAQAGVALAPALQHAWKAQVDLIAKLKRKFQGENTGLLLGQPT